ncbi:MAG TPA: DUF1592 domain-containing protein [Gemmatimonadales bacterium]|nr:DUF1592 domain-containing protein [Gemmatimonadales bacterium]
MTKRTLPLLGAAVFSVGLAALGEPAAPVANLAAASSVSAAAAGSATVTGPTRTSTAASDSVSTDALNRVVRGLCVLCHNPQAMTGNLSLADFDVAAPEKRPDVAEKMIRKLRAGMMPPPGVPRPGGDTLRALAETLERRIDAVAAANPNPGSRSFQRLNREEYRASIRDLLGLEIDAGDYLPLDTKSANFDNIADVQLPSATLVDGYLRAAAQISRIAVGDPTAGPTSATYKVPRTASQLDRVEGAPIGTRGGTSVVHHFLADGLYVFQVMLHSAPEGELYGRTALNEQIEISIDGERAALLDIDRWMTESDPNGMTITTDSIFVPAGPHRVTAAFIQRFEGVVDDLVTPVDHTLADTQIGLGYGVTTLPHLRDLAIVGPYVATGVSDTPTRRRIFTCRPTAPEEARPCAEGIVRRLAAQAYRRPLSADDVRDLMGFYDRGARDGGFESGIRTALQAILASPHFLFRLEEAPARRFANGDYPVSDADLASRLSFFLWGTPPDQELIDVAARGELSRPGTLKAQARRLLADPRSEALATRFAAQWLRLQDLEKVHPDALSYPYFDQTLAAAMYRETTLFFTHLVREDRSFFELLTADYTFVNERLARHYGIPNVNGPEFRRVTYPDATRRGLLGHGSILTLTSHADRTSPVLRGKWVMEVLLGTPPPPPPPNVPAFEQTEGAREGRLLTTRERMEMHRANPVCMACHQFMDPIGLALDNFDVTGKWRIKENGMPLDTRGRLYDGTDITNPEELTRALLKRPEPLVRNFTANLLAYAIGRRVEWYDMPTVRAIERDAAAAGHHMSAFVMGVVNSLPFRMNRADVTISTSGSSHPEER